MPLINDKLKMRRLTIFRSAMIAALICPLGLSAQKQIKQKPEVSKIIDQNFADADKQYRLLMHHVPVDSMAETFEKGKWVSVAANNWVSGFYPGTLLYIYEATGDKELYAEGIKRLKVMEPEQTIDSHDIGFMMNDSYGIANQIAPNPEYKQVLITSAKSLAKRFNPVVGCTMSWASQPGQF